LLDFVNDLSEKLKTCCVPEICNCTSLFHVSVTVHTEYHCYLAFGQQHELRLTDRSERDQ